MSNRVISKPSTKEYREGWDRIFGNTKSNFDYICTYDPGCFNTIVDCSKCKYSIPIDEYKENYE